MGWSCWFLRGLVGVYVEDASVWDDDSSSYVGGVDAGDEGVVGVGFGPQPAGADGGFWGVDDDVWGLPVFGDADGVFPYDGDQWRVFDGFGVGWDVVPFGLFVPYMVSYYLVWFHTCSDLPCCSPPPTSTQTGCFGFWFRGLVLWRFVLWRSWSCRAMMALLMVFWFWSCCMRLMASWGAQP